jgi:hypothetical protein
VAHLMRSATMHAGAVEDTVRLVRAGSGRLRMSGER